LFDGWAHQLHIELEVDSGYSSPDEFEQIHLEPQMKAPVSERCFDCREVGHKLCVHARCEVCAFASDCCEKQQQKTTYLFPKEVNRKTCRKAGQKLHQAVCDKKHKYANCPFNQSRDDGSHFQCNSCKKFVNNFVFTGVCRKCSNGAVRDLRKSREDKENFFLHPQGFFGFAGDKLKETMQPTFDSFAETLASASRTIVDHSKDTVSAMAGQTVSSLETFATFTKDNIVIILTGLAAFLAVLCSDASKTAKIAAFGGFLVIFKFSDKIRGFLLNYFLPLIDDMKMVIKLIFDPSPLFAQGPADLMLHVGSAIAALFMCVFAKFMPGKYDIDSVLRRIDLIPKAIAGADKFYVWAVDIARKVVEYIFQKAGKPSPFEPRVPESLANWIDEVQVLVSTPLTDATYTQDFASKVQACYIKGTQLTAELSKLGAPKEVREAIFSTHSQIKSLQHQIAHMGCFAAPRPEPLFIYLYGGSGVGKSGLTNALFIELAKSDPTLDPTKWSQLIYQRQVENVYWDGLQNGQPFFLYDDFGQMRDSASLPNLEYMEVIRLANLLPMQPHMAHLTEKGLVFARPKAVLLTSNLPDPAEYIKSLVCPDAFKRRLDICAEVRVKKEYAKTTSDGQVRLDPSKTKTNPDLEVYEFWLEDGNILDWQEFMDVLKKDYLKRLSKSEDVINNLNVMAGLKAQMPSPTKDVYFDAEDEMTNSLVPTLHPEFDVQDPLDIDIEMDRPQVMPIIFVMIMEYLGSFLKNRKNFLTREIDWYCDIVVFLDE
jgi:hypothetical protein